ncbi:hypothetical protein BD769DRAFT_1695923 [Suillus cothurnatus]|nr:hypothetical protein BD769DRAFT_1695923 [Suillus cothurnatus]
MDYSSDDIAAARSFQFATYIYTSMAAFWVYDYACSLHGEWSFLLRSHWNKVKGLYVATRYLPFILLTTNLYMNFTPNESPSRCRVLANIDSGIGMVSVVFSECFFILRTYALWDNNKILLAAMASTFFVSFRSTHDIQASGKCISQAFLVASFSIAFTTTVPAPYATSVIPGITGCYQSTTSFQLFIPFLLLFAFELGLMILTLIRAIQSWRTNTNRLFVVLVNHSISYYACGLLFSVVNIFTSRLLQYSYHSMLHDFQFMILAVLATRMHLHLWQINQHGRKYDTFVCIPMSDMSFQVASSTV